MSLNEAKQLSNAFSTGGGGFTFESRVQSAFVALMLARGVCPCLAYSWPVAEVALQARHRGYETDDTVIVTRNDNTGAECRLLLQIKHSISFSENDSQMPDVIGAAWRDFNRKTHFDADRDSIALVTGPISKNDSKNVCHVLDVARGASDATDFFSKISQSKAYSDAQRNKLKTIRFHVTNANNGANPNDEEFWSFLKCYYLIGFDMDLMTGVTTTLIQSLIGAHSNDDVQAVWNMIVQEVQQKGSVSGVLTRDSISQLLKDSFKQEEIMPVVPIAPNPIKETIALNLIGGWDESTDGDRSIVESLSGMAFRDWQEKIRKIWKDQPMSMLEQHNGKWSVTDRLTLWESEGPLLNDDLLDNFGKLAILVLLESDPELALPKEQRFAVSVYGQSRKYSKKMRKGVAETMALMGARPGALITCSQGKSETVAYQVVDKLLGAASSERWASLNDVLPLLAEASPDAFLQAVSGASEKKDEPFFGVFSEEVGGVMGRTYASGLLWALESLAWSPDYLVRVCAILANLAAVDPGGTYSNRPSNSIVTILLPWHPYTCADTDCRHNAIKCIIREQPEVAWEVLIGLLPKHHGVSFPTHKPKWQPFIPEDFKERVSVEQRLTDEGFYADLALEMAENDSIKLGALLPFYFYINPRFSSFAEDYRKRLTSEPVRNLPEENRLELWIELTTRTGNHRKYADSKAWAVPEQSLQELEEIADALKPQEPEVKHRRLFSGRDMDLYDETGDWNEQRDRLLRKRIEALIEIQERCGLDGLKNFWRSVESPNEVGNACGAEDALTNDSEFLPTLLESDDESDYRFAIAYVWRRFYAKEWDWVDSLDRSSWSLGAKAEFFAIFPSIKETWQRAETELLENSAEYWKRTRVHPDRDHLEDFDHAIRQLIANNRSDAAIQCFWLGDIWDGPYPDLALQALETFDLDKNQMDAHAIHEIFNHLQKIETVDEERLASMEFRFLNLLDRFGGARPLTLYRHLAERSEFFCDVIRMLYKSRNENLKEENEDTEVDEKKARVASNAYALLMDWNHPPGLLADGSYDDDRLKIWIKATKESCTKSGHWEVASHQIGEVLYYAPKDDRGLWIEPVSELLNSKDHAEFRRGLKIRIFNSRGVHGDSGGKEEIELAEKWEGLASQAESKGLVRLATTLRDLGQSYREDAKRYEADHRHDYD